MTDTLFERSQDGVYRLMSKDSYVRWHNERRVERIDWNSKIVRIILLQILASPRDPLALKMVMRVNTHRPTARKRCLFRFHPRTLFVYELIVILPFNRNLINF